MTNGTDLVTNSIGHQFIKNQNVVSLYQIHKKRKMKKRHIAHTIDLLFCLVIIPLSVMLLPVDRWIAHNTAFLFTLIAYVYALYFVYRKACLPKLFLEKKYLKIVLLLTVLIVLTQLLTHFPIPAERITDDVRQMEARMNMRRQTIWFFFLFVTGFSLAIELIFELFRQILSRQEIEAEKNKAELALYKAQINPHFLFNTLNTLYALVLCRSEYTEAAFVKFSNILKYMYHQATADTIDLQSEIDYIRQYVELQQLRLNQHTQVIFECNTDRRPLQIPPMLLFTFIENAFKYGSSPDEDCCIQIRIETHENELHFFTCNRIMKEKSKESPAIGIDNCRKRLNMLYPGKYQLDIGQEKGFFNVSLHIKLLEK